ncbi:MAG TPA: SOS response-associated peptidase [Terriglobia bacterium]|nr:SOS response-associated peptidase [Terriglobia bacterium]
MNGMCGRYSIAVEPSLIEERFGATVGGAMQPRYNAAPSQLLPVILNADPGKIVFSHWGIRPVWMSHVSKKDGLINVRYETLRDKATFRTDLALRRCLIPANGFYEWNAVSGSKVPFRITRSDGKLFAFAGLWQEGSGEPSVLPRFAIITTAADAFMQPIHARMPVILDPEEEKAWIEKDADLGDLLRLLETPYSSPMRAYEVSRDVNRASVDVPDLIRPADHAADDAPLFKAARK